MRAFLAQSVAQRLEGVNKAVRASACSMFAEPLGDTCERLWVHVSLAQNKLFYLNCLCERGRTMKACQLNMSESRSLFGASPLLPLPSAEYQSELQAAALQSLSSGPAPLTQHFNPSLPQTASGDKHKNTHYIILLLFVTLEHYWCVIICNNRAFIETQMCSHMHPASSNDIHA